MRVRNDISVRKRLTIGISGFAIVATGCYFAGRTVYRSRKAKKVARLEAAHKKELMAASASTLPVVPSVENSTESVESAEPVEPVEPAKEEIVEEEEIPEAVTETEQVEEGAIESAKEDVIEPAEEEVVPVHEVGDEVAPEEPEGIPSVLSEEPAEEILTEVDDETEYQPWWTGVKEISLFLSPEEATKLDDHFPASRPYKC